MATQPFAPINTLLSRQRAAIGEEWLAEIQRAWHQRYPGLVNEEDLRRQAERLLDELAATFATHEGDTPPVIGDDTPLAETARELSAERAKAGFKPVDTAQYVIGLKNVITRHLVQDLQDSPGKLAACLTAVDDVLDRLSLLTFESYVDSRERVIVRQSLSLLELSTPVIRLWDQVLLLPLVGVIDTMRARQFTERLLEAITRFEASVTIIDVTGVPVFDTGVARHIMKTVDAAQLLGTRIVLTGISPEGAQTLTKLGVNFSGVVSRASLRAGVAEALKLIGMQIAPFGGARA